VRCQRLSDAPSAGQPVEPRGEVRQMQDTKWPAASPHARRRGSNRDDGLPARRPPAPGPALPRAFRAEPNRMATRQPPDVAVAERSGSRAEPQAMTWSSIVSRAWTLYSPGFEHTEVFEFGYQRERDLLAHIGHLQLAGDETQVLGRSRAADRTVGDEPDRLVVPLGVR